MLGEVNRKLRAAITRQFRVVFDAIRELMTPPQSNKRKIGFLVKEPTARAEERKVVTSEGHHFDVSRILETWKFRQERGWAGFVVLETG